MDISIPDTVVFKVRDEDAPLRYRNVCFCCAVNAALMRHKVDTTLVEVKYEKCEDCGEYL